MTKKAYKTEDGKLALLNTAYNECLHSDHWIAGREQNRFEKLYLHVTKTSRKIFYVVYVTFWQGEENSITVIGENKIQGWLQDNYQSLTTEEIKRFAALGFKLEETA